MSRFRLILSVFMVSLVSIIFSVNALAQTTTTVVEKRTIVTPAPKSGNCTTVAAHWEGDVWVDTQTVCSYTGRSEGAAWVQDYWACTASTADGTCTAWQFRPGHWVATYP